MQITANVYRLDSSKGAYVYLVTGKETILIDTGYPWACKRILHELEQLGIAPKKIHHILLTHGDIDHIGNAFYFQSLTGAALWAAPAEIPMITGAQPYAGIKKYFSSLFSIRKPDKLQPYPPNLKVGEIEIVPAPGHTAGHVCLRYRDVLFAGDLLVVKESRLVPHPAMWSWNRELHMRSFDKIIEEKFHWICPAHSDPLEITNAASV